MVLFHEAAQQWRKKVIRLIKKVKSDEKSLDKVNDSYIITSIKVAVELIHAQ
jgi:hypothetical protein